MNTILKRITRNCLENDNSKYYEKVGNYEIIRNENYIIHKYFGNTICIVDLNSKQFSLYFAGYSGYRLTTAQINYLEKFYLSRNYKLRIKKVD